MELKNLPFSATKKELDWIAKAASKDAAREVLCQAAIVHIDGRSYLASTDTHRLHLLNLGKSEAHEVVMFDIRRLLWEMQFSKATRCEFDECGHFEAWAKTNPVRIFAPLVYTGTGQYPNIARVIPVGLDGPPMSVALKAKYFADATALDGGEGFQFFGSGPDRAVLICQNSSNNRWQAVVMPTRSREITPLSPSQPQEEQQ